MLVFFAKIHTIMKKDADGLITEFELGDVLTLGRNTFTVGDGGVQVLNQYIAPVREDGLGILKKHNVVDLHIGRTDIFTNTREIPVSDIFKIYRVR